MAQRTDDDEDHEPGRRRADVDRLVDALERIVLSQTGALIAELRGLRADLRHHLVDGRNCAGLVIALREFFGTGSFTSGSVLIAADDDPDLADALGSVIDMNAEPMSRAVQLGILLKRLPGVERCGKSRGAGLYRVAP